MNAHQLPKKDKNIDKASTDLPKRKIIGYILLDQSYNKFDPIYVGCIFFKVKTQ